MGIFVSMDTHDYSYEDDSISFEEDDNEETSSDTQEIATVSLKQSNQFCISMNFMAKIVDVFVSKN